MKPLLISILLTLIFTVPAWAWQKDTTQLRFNPMADKFEYAAPGDRLKYNAPEDEWSYERPGSRLRHNPMEDKFEYTD